MHAAKWGGGSHHLGHDARFTLTASTHPGGKITTVNTAGQARVEVSDSIRSTDWLVFMYFTTTVNIAASCQIPMGHGQRRSERQRERERQIKQG